MSRAPVLDADVIVPATQELTLRSGTVVVLEPLNLRQYLAIMRIVTRPAGPLLMGLHITGDEDDDALIGKVLGMVLIAIPDAEEEAVAAIRGLVRPAGLAEGRDLDKADRERNRARREQLRDELDNPDPFDVVSIIEATVRANGNDMVALGKRLMQAWQLMSRTGQIPSPTSSAANSSAT